MGGYYIYIYMYVPISTYICTYVMTKADDVYAYG